MQKHLELSLSVILQTAVMIQGQSISPLTTPYPVQATNSTVVITATASPPSSVISSGGNWIVDWRYNGTRVAQAGYVPYPDVDSAADSSIYSSRINISAVAMSASNFTTQLTIAQLRADEDGYQVELGGIGIGFDSQPIVLDIRDCNSSLPYDVIVDTTSRIFNSPGKFACSNGGNLFYSNGIILTSSDTTCLASAEWSDQDNLQCWTAPNVTLASSSIEGNKLIVIEGANLSLTCNYNDVIPEGSTSRLYIGGNNYNRTQGEPFILSSLQRSDSNKVVSCQAVTPYTDAYPASGRSLEYTLDVLYLSLSVVNTIQISQYVIESSESNYLLRSDQQLTMNCTPSDANPPATCSWQLCSDSRCQILTSDGVCLISVDLNASSNVTCNAENVVGIISSAEQTVDVIPAERQVQFNVTGNNVANDGSINSTTYLGEHIIISCSVSYENELSTAYLIKLPDNTMVSQSSKLFSSVTRFDTGDYICNTNDQFGSFNAAIYLNVIYAATQDDKIPACNWNLNETEICSVVFFSNPNSLFISLSKNGSSVASDGSMTIESTGDQQTFTFTRTQVTNSDNGSYELTVKSSSGSLFSNSVLYFHIEVVDNTNDNGEPLGTPGLSTGAIAGIIAGVVVVILCAAGYGVYKWRNGSQEKNGSRSNEMYPTGSGNRTLTDQPGYIDVTANDSTQINSDNQRNYEVVGPAEDENGYLAVHGSTTDHLRNRASNSQLETDNAGYIVLNGEESNAQSNNQENASSSSKRYENIEGAYDDVITTPRVHTENVSRRYENVEGPYDEINKS
ncbi:uncharacterized protein LOC143446905 isoform X2 [Clavelina lepadiformis]|uniref:uncharacterized protein LOC143446905 isoform X2 n=1 Tax=Clavelina lepadiformis TaxID=159417 RepID=UPI004042822C